MNRSAQLLSLSPTRWEKPLHHHSAIPPSSHLCSCLSLWLMIPIIYIAVSENYMNAVNLYYGPILMTFPALNTIESVCDTKNWIFVPDSGGSLNY